jgi:hypothetical protein
MSKFKKIVSITTSITTIAMVSGIAMLAPLAANATIGGLAEGAIFKTAASPDVYIAKYVGSKAFKRLILSPSVFNSYGHLKWSNIQTVDQATMDAFKVSTLVRAVGDPKVYDLAPVPNSDSGGKHWVNMTADQFTSCSATNAAFDWDSVYQINTVDRDSYTASSDDSTCTLATETTVPSGSIVASLSADTPPMNSLVSGQAIADLAHFTFTGTGTITQIVIRRLGVSADSVLANVYLYNGNNKISDAGSISNGLVTFNNASGLFTVNGTYTIKVRADISGGVGQNVLAQLASYTISGGTPITTTLTGNIMGIASAGNLATVFLTNAGAIGGVSGNITAGLMNQNLWSGNLSISQRTVNLNYVRFKQIGSIPANAVQNLKLLLDGSPVGSIVSIDGSNNVIFDLNASPVAMTSGSHILELHGDVVAGSGLTFDFSLQTPSDIVLLDTSYGVNLLLTNGGGTPVFSQQPAVSNVVGGSVSVQLDPNFTATQFVKNASNVVLGQWTIKAYGEDVKDQTLNVVINYFKADGVSTIVPATTDGFNNLAVYVNGGQVGSSQNALIGATNTATTTKPFGTTNLFTIPAGTTVTVAVKGDNVLTAGSLVAIIRVDLVTPANSLQGAVSYTLSPTPNPILYTGRALSAATGAATLAKNNGYSDQNVTANLTNQKIGSYTIQAGNADGIRVTSLTVLIAGTLNNPGAASAALANLKIVSPDGTSTPINPSTSNNFSTNFTVAASGTATVDVFADVSNPTQLGTIVTSLYGTGTGVTSVQPVYLTTDGLVFSGANAVIGQTITVGTGNLSTVAFNSSASASSQILTGGLTSFPIATYTFTAAVSGGVTIQELRFNASSSIVSITAGGITAPVIGTGLATTSVLAGLNIAVPTGYAGTNIIVNASMANAGINGVIDGQSGILLTFVKFQAGSVVSSVSAPTAPLNGNESSRAMFFAATNPTISLSPGVSGSMSSASKLGSVTISAGAGGPVNLKQLPIVIATSSGTVMSVTGPVVVKDPSNGNATVITGGAMVNGTQNVTFTGGYSIAANSSKTFDIYAVVNGALGAAGTTRINMSLDTASLNGNFIWDDVNGGPSGANLTGQYILSYPVLPVSFTN